MKNEKLHKVLILVLFLIFAIVTAKKCFLSGRMGWEDEAHFWTIVKYCSPLEVFELMKVEGHMMLWYLVVMPFAKLGLHYPVPMQILNWVFCISALAIMWKKAPFNALIKAGITFSPVFFSLYSVHARCYSIGIFFLFCACALYKDRLKHPYWLFLMLFLAANTSMPALIGATSIGLLFLYDLFKESYENNESYKIPILITIFTVLTGLLFYIQLSGAAIPDYEHGKKDVIQSMNYLAMFYSIIPTWVTQTGLEWKLHALRVFVFVLTLVMATRFRAFFVYMFNFMIASYFFLNVYRPRLWHLAFFFIYFVISYWIFEEEKPDKIAKNIGAIISYIFLVFFITIEIFPPHFTDFLSDTIINDKNLSNGKIFTTIAPITLSVVLTPLNESDIFLYDMNGRNLSKYEGLKTYYNRKAKAYKGFYIYWHMDKDKKNFLIASKDITKFNDFKKVKLKLYQKGQKEDRKYYIYEVLPSQNKKNPV